MNDQLQNDLKRLEELKVQMDALKPVKEEYDLLKEQVRFELEAQHLKSLKTNKINVSISEKQTLQITDEPTVIDWLVKNKFEVDEYLRLDTTRVQPLVLSKLKVDGEIVPGTKLVSTPYLSIRGVK